MLKKYQLVLAVAAFIVNSKKQILIVEKSPYEMVDAGLWTVPGGKVRPDEHIIDALKREVEEEVGLTIKNYQWIGEDVFLSNNQYFHGEHFYCPVYDEEKIILEKRLLGYRWINKDEVGKYEFHPNITKEIKFVFSKFIKE